MIGPKVRPVILAGGKGTRLWPASRKKMPKQFCKFGDAQSLFQETASHLAGSSLFEPPIILTTASHLSVVKTQLDEIGVTPALIMLEPEGRDTAAAIALTTFIHDSEELLLALPSDHKIGNPGDLFQSIRTAAQYCVSEDKIIAFGIQPNEPATQFGYIQKGTGMQGQGLHQIKSFKEKPDLETATRYVESGEYLWNAGMFLYTNKRMAAELAEHCPELFDCVKCSFRDGTIDNGIVAPKRESFEKIKPISIDFAVMEKTSNAIVCPVDPNWSDVGSWDAVWQTSNRDCDNNVVSGRVVSEGSSGSILNSNGPILGVNGLENMVVVADHDVVMITPRGASQGIKQLVAKIEEKHPEVVDQHPGENRPWGSFTSLHRGEMHQVKSIEVTPGGQLSLQYHFHRAEQWVVVRGVATVTVDNEVFDLIPGQTVRIPQGATHRLENLTEEPVEIIEVQFGHYLGEDDIVRVDDVYGRPEVEMPTAQNMRRSA